MALTHTDLIAACDRILAKSPRPSDDCHAIATHLRDILTGAKAPRKGPQKATDPRHDATPQQQIHLWLTQYLDAVGVHLDGMNETVAMRIRRTMAQQQKTLSDVQKIIQTMAREKAKPRTVGYLITVIESRMGRVA